MNRFKENLSRLTKAVSEKFTQKNETDHKRLSKEEVERRVKRHLSALMKGVDTPEALKSLAELKAQGITSTPESCLKCGTKLIVAWSTDYYLKNSDGKNSMLAYEVVSRMMILPQPCSAHPEGMHTITGM